MIAGSLEGARAAIMGDVFVEEVTQVSGLKARIEHMRELAECASEPNVFFEHWFLIPALSYLANGEDIRVLLGWDCSSGDDRTLVGLIPVTNTKRIGGLPLPAVRTWLHVHAFLGTPLVRRDFERAFAEALLRHMDAAPWAKGFLQLSALSEEGCIRAALEEAAQSEHRRLRYVRKWERAEVRTKEDAETYITTTISKKRLKNLKRLKARLSEAGQLTDEAIGSPGQADLWCNEFLRIEASGWKGQEATAMAANEQESTFLRAVVRGAANEGKAALVRLDLDERAIAMLVNFRSGGAIFCLKTAYDEEFAKFSPGALIELEGIRYALASEDFCWMDSCASSQSAVNALWGERRQMTTLRVELKGALNTLLFRSVDAAEQFTRRRRSVDA